ncbi:MAG TPA: phosphoribosylformylglycinamidine cyclo-ligase [Candidatus Acidoferrum sp.]|nr:phosphoribosylformylglycinamidine cyclo-ligase [Candidatus Acidoferrum sp.]
MSDPGKKKKLTYAAAGVDVRANDEAVARIKSLARATFGPQVLSEIGSFGGFYKAHFPKMKSPVLVSSTDGVGTKLKLACMIRRHNTVGEDLVNHCVNDILVHGARPLFFLDYIGIHKLEPPIVAEIVSGLARACSAQGMALIGGETAEMPDIYQVGDYDLAGTIIGVVDEPKIINGSTIKNGDICIGLPSTGLHTNGYTLARKVVFEIAKLRPEDKIPELKSSVADALMAVHRCYASVVFKLLEKFSIHGMAHITGGGLPGNLNRILPDNLDAEVVKGSWPVLPIFEYLQAAGSLDREDIYSAFNMGIGYVLVVAEKDAASVLEALAGMGEKAFRIGAITPGHKQVRLV